VPPCTCTVCFCVQYTLYMCSVHYTYRMARCLLASRWLSVPSWVDTILCDVTVSSRQGHITSRPEAGEHPAYVWWRRNSCQGSSLNVLVAGTQWCDRCVTVCSQWQQDWHTVDVIITTMAATISWFISLLYSPILTVVRWQILACLSSSTITQCWRHSVELRTTLHQRCYRLHSQAQQRTRRRSTAGVSASSCSSGIHLCLSL